MKLESEQIRQTLHDAQAQTVAILHATRRHVDLMDSSKIYGS